MAKSTEKKDVTVFKTPTSTKDVPQAIEALKERLKALKGKEDEKISIDISYNHTNIKTVKSVSELLEISSAVHARSDAYDKEIERYKLSEKNIKNFEVSGKSVNQWEKIIEKAINELINKTQIDKIQSAITELSKHLDAETKLQNTLKNIMGDVSAEIS
jgi:hypothetical protein